MHLAAKSMSLGESANPVVKELLKPRISSSEKIFYELDNLSPQKIFKNELFESDNNYL